MTVIDAFLDRPKVVPKQKLSIGVRKRKQFETQPFMPEVRGCILGGRILTAKPNQFCSMDGNDETVTEPDVDAEHLKKGIKEGSNGSSLPFRKQKILVKNNRTTVRNRRKSRWKLKFHHQALPPEYLRHYKQQERKRRQSETSKHGQANTHGKKPFKKSQRKIVSETVQKTRENLDVNPFKMEESPNSDKREENAEALTLLTRSPLALPGTRENINEIDRKRSSIPSDSDLPARSCDEVIDSGVAGIPQLDIDVSQNKAFLENLLTNQIEINRVEQKERKISNMKTPLPQFNKIRSVKPEERQKAYSIPPSGKIMNYSDLPYMGEITLDGIKPRRGRKPKKADICHLIYKNYGQVFPGAPGKEPDIEDATKRRSKWREEVNTGQINSSQRTKGSVTEAERPDSPLPTVSGLINHTEVQNRIINSLLEKRLTQEMKLKSHHSKGEEGKGCSAISEDEPLNLCLRDLQSLKIKLSRKHGNIYETKQRDTNRFKVNIKTEVDEGSNPEVTSLDKAYSEGYSTDENDDEEGLAPFNLVTTELRESSDEDTFLNLGDQITLTKVKSLPSKKDLNTPELQPETESSPMLFWPCTGLLLPGMPPSSLRVTYKLPEAVASPFGSNKEETVVARHERRFLRTKSDSGRSHLKRMAPQSATSKQAQVITKRKRSAIFIPPVPAESTVNPTTEVSICKFKFTGGAKPSLQEKKMLSVDSGGNFRYYSGTGDKSMRGYEYFPRESLQQCQENTGCSPAGVFLTASALGSGEKIPEEIGHSGFFDTDFPLQVCAPRTPEPKPKLKSKRQEGEKKRCTATCYKSLREHLLTSKPDTFSANTTLDDTDKDDCNSSDQSERDFDLGPVSQACIDSYKIHSNDDSNQITDLKIRETSSKSRRLRKTRKSIAREKLEQTFKEKGFLIQTQQLESAEGATYCKFRQLRKFTRYLFRSWRNYLPGNVRDLSVDAGVDNPEMLMHIPETSAKADVADYKGHERFK